MKRYAAGIDIGGTRTKIGIVELETATVSKTVVLDTCRESEEAFLQSVNEVLEHCLKEQELEKKELLGVGVSIGSYVFEDGTIDGMSCFVPYMTEGYPLGERFENTLQLPVRADNDVRLIGLAESRYGAGRGYARTLTVTLGSGVGIGVCVNGKPMGEEAFCHLAGHIKVRSGNDIPVLDEMPCYCGIKGCLESTCSGASFEKYLRSIYGTAMTNQEFFEKAAGGNQEMLVQLKWYLDMLAEGLNQYIYIYCPDIIILGGGVSKGLIPWEKELENRLTAKVHFRQQTALRISLLMEAGGILGAATLYDL